MIWPIHVLWARMGCRIGCGKRYAHNDRDFETPRSGRVHAFSTEDMRLEPVQDCNLGTYFMGTVQRVHNAPTVSGSQSRNEGAEKLPISESTSERAA